MRYINLHFTYLLTYLLKCVATLPCEMSGVLKATIENKTTSVTTYFKGDMQRFFTKLIQK